MLSWLWIDAVAKQTVRGSQGIQDCVEDFITISFTVMSENNEPVSRSAIISEP